MRPFSSIQRNVGHGERLASAAGGLALAVLGLRGRGFRRATGVGLGLGLIARGATGYCPVNAVIDRSTASTVQAPKHFRIAINRTASELLQIAEANSGRLLGGRRGEIRVTPRPTSTLSVLEVVFDRAPLSPMGVHAVGETLRQFKMRVETGEVATAAGPHGARSAFGDAFLNLLTLSRRPHHAGRLFSRYEESRRRDGSGSESLESAGRHP